MSDRAGITKQELTALFRAVFEQHSEKLATIAAFSREERGFDPAIDIADETVMGWAYRIRSANGMGATLSARQRDAMMEAGLAASAVDDVAALLSQWQATGKGNPSATRLRAQLEALGVPELPAPPPRSPRALIRRLGSACRQAQAQARSASVSTTGPIWNWPTSR